jgi:hypothetical protein
MTTDTFRDTHLTGSISSKHPRTARRIGSVLAGLVTIFFLSTATDMALHATGIYPPFGETMSDALFVLAAAYRVVYGIAGCYVTARLAPYNPLWHSLALGVVGLILSIAGSVAMWDAGPAWYSLVIIAMPLPCAWLGAKLRLAELQKYEQ